MEILKDAFQTPIEDECYMIAIAAIKAIESGVLLVTNASLVKSTNSEYTDWNFMSLQSTLEEGIDFEVIPTKHW
jgi:hypothetical protein